MAEPVPDTPRDFVLDRNDDLDMDAIDHKDAKTPPAVVQRVEIKRR